jgi:TetR/AcrR family transcriptional regulator
VGEASVAQMTWAERAADRSPVVQRSRSRGVQQAKAIVQAARRLIEVKGPTFTTQDLVREAGIALQTFYRYFPGKDHLLLAVIEDIIDENCKGYKEGAAKLRNPVDRLRSYITATLASLEGARQGPSFITVEHWRLQTLYPDEVSRATQPYTDLILEEIREATASGLMKPRDPEYSAWLITQLVMTVFHHYDCAGLDEPSELVAGRLWTFCLSALGGQTLARVNPSPVRSRRSAGRASG